MSQHDVDRGFALVCGGFSLLFAVLAWVHRREDQ